jgi:hypothetical protein
VPDRPPHEYVPAGPLESAPGGGYRDPKARREAFAAVLAGVVVGGYDWRITNWLCGLDDPTCRTVASLMWRARLAGRAAEGTVTEWGVRHPTSRQRDCVDMLGEQAARAVLPTFQRTYGDRAALVSRQVGPWTEVPETEPREDGEHG